MTWFVLQKLSADIQGDIEDAVNIKLHAVGKLQLKNQVSLVCQSVMYPVPTVLVSLY